MEKLLERIQEIASRKNRFTYDIRGHCFVERGVVAAYRASENSDHFSDLPGVITHALAHEGILGSWLDPADGKRYYDSCRVFSDEGTAFSFAQRQGQKAVYNLNRGIERAVPDMQGKAGNSTTVIPDRRHA
jgi:hypothetical protein